LAPCGAILTKPARTNVAPSRGAAVKIGRLFGGRRRLGLEGREHGGRMICAGIEQLLCETVLERNRREITDARMTSPWIIKTLDELKDRDPGLRLRLESPSIQQLAFEGGEKTLAHRIVPRVKPEGRLHNHRPSPSTA